MIQVRFTLQLLDVFLDLLLVVRCQVQGHRDLRGQRSLVELFKSRVIGTNVKFLGKGHQGHDRRFTVKVTKVRNIEILILNLFQGQRSRSHD